MTMTFRHLRLALAAFLAAAVVGLGLPGAAWAQDEDEDGDNVLESDEVSGDEDEEYEEEDDTTVQDTDPSAVVIFRDRLSPYGSWMEHPTYGTVWVPSSRLVGSDFAPYVSSGHWELTEEGDWLWVSDYEWGYIPFHYGRWVWVSNVGWAWIPGRVYAPAWVVWRTGASGYIGWAPMPPAYYWADGVAVSLWLVPPAAYVFCPGHHVFHHHVHTHVVHDRTEVRRAADATVAYTPSKATAKSNHKPASPTLKEAGIDPKSAPKSYGKHDPKATAFMRPDGKSSKAAFGKSGSAPRTGKAVRGGSKGSGSAGSRMANRPGGSSSFDGSDARPVKRSKKGSFSSGAMRGTKGRKGVKTLGGSRAPSEGRDFDGPSTSAPSRGDAPSTSGRTSKPSRSSGSSNKSNRSSSDAPPSRSSSGSRSDGPSFGGSSRPSSPSPSPSRPSSAPSVKRSPAPAPAPVRRTPSTSRPSRGRR
jgi:hypothetical protein